MTKPLSVTLPAGVVPRSELSRSAMGCAALVPAGHALDMHELTAAAQRDHGAGARYPTAIGTGNVRRCPSLAVERHWRSPTPIGSGAAEFASWPARKGWRCL